MNYCLKYLRDGILVCVKLECCCCPKETLGASVSLCQMTSISVASSGESWWSLQSWCSSLSGSAVPTEGDTLQMAKRVGKGKLGCLDKCLHPQVAWRGLKGAKN